MTEFSDMKSYMKKLKNLSYVLPAAVLIAGCSIGENEFGKIGSNDGLVPITISGGISQLYETRADDGGFTDGDKVGIYVVDYVDGVAGELKLSGNRASNLQFMYSESENRWVPSRDIYWKDAKTNIDVYGYYPIGTPNSIEAFEFSVQRDQNAPASGNDLSGYEQSDFLWGSALGQSPTDKTIMLSFKHKMASARITLAEGTGFDSAQWATLSKNVMLESAVRDATINLKTGEVTAKGDVPATGTIALSSGNDWRVIVVPQTIAAG